MKKKHYLIIFIVILTASGCKKFLSESSQDLQYVHNSEQLDELLVGDGYESKSNNYAQQSINYFIDDLYFPWLNAMDDDITEYVSPNGGSGLDDRNDVFGFYTWQANPFVLTDYGQRNDYTWTQIYKHINAANIIAQKATELNDNPSALKRIRGEALFLRAGYYFHIVNAYAKAYDINTAVSDPAVPLKITNYVEDNFFSRSTVDSVYKQIVADLQEAAVDLQGVVQPSIYRANEVAANLLLSRAYLFMQDWENAIKYADKVIAAKGTLYNLETYSPQTSFLSSSSPEAIFTQGNNAIIPLMLENGSKCLQPSDGLLSLYETSDLRRSAFFEYDVVGKNRYAKVYYSSYYGVTPDGVYSDNFFMRSSEAYLNKAEAEAMLGHDESACASINILREARMEQSNYHPIQLGGQSLSDFIMNERRRELCFEGFRWFDLKRYAIREKYPFTTTIRHPYSEAGAAHTPPHLRAILELPPNDPAYLIPIPDFAIIFNEGMLQQNPMRPDRKF